MDVNCAWRVFPAQLTGSKRKYYNKKNNKAIGNDVDKKTSSAVSREGRLWLKAFNGSGELLPLLNCFAEHFSKLSRVIFVTK